MANRTCHNSPAQRLARQRNAQRWHAKPKEPEQWFATPAGPGRILDRNSAEFAEIAARYGKAAP